MGYLLYINRHTRELKVKKPHKGLSTLPFTEAVQKHNDNFYYSTDRKALTQLGREIKAQWVAEAQAELDRLNTIKI